MQKFARRVGIGVVPVIVRRMNVDQARYDSIYNPFSPAAHFALVAIAEASCVLSLFGSISIIYLIVRKNKLFSSGGKHVFHHIMFGLSLGDFVTTCGFLLQPFLIPSYTHKPLAVGNTTTCEIAGFLGDFVITSPMYSCILSIYFLLTVRSGWSVEKTSRILEPWIHFVAWMPPLLLASVSAAADLYNPRPLTGLCFTGYNPVDCAVNPDVSCERGGTLPTYISYGYLVLTVPPALVGIVCTWILHNSIVKQFRRSDRFDFRRIITARSSVIGASATVIDDAIPSTTDLHRRAIARQAVWYSVAFLNTFMSALVGVVVTTAATSSLEKLNTLQEASPGPYVAILVMCTMHPLQGFLNWLIYILPTIARWRDAYPDRSMLWAYRQILDGQITPVTRKTVHLLNRQEHIEAGEEQGKVIATDA